MHTKHLLISALIVVFTGLTHATVPSPDPDPTSGPYIVVQGRVVIRGTTVDTTIRLDAKTGRTWTLSHLKDGSLAWLPVLESSEYFILKAKEDQAEEFAKEAMKSREELIFEVSPTPRPAPTPGAKKSKSK